MGINFPPNPTFPNPPNVGDHWPSPPTAGLPVYRWDGEKWTTVGTGPSKIPVYTDGSTSMTAQLKLIAPPIAPEDAAAKSYVDSLAIGTLLYGGGLQINGGMEVSQELGASGRANPGYICDGWPISFLGTMAVAAQQGSSPAVPGFPNWLAVNVTTAQASLGAGDYCQIYQPIEGYRVARLGWGTASAQPITIGFWTAHTPVGVYSVSIRNGTTNRSYATTYTQTSAGAWQYHVVTIPGDTAGTWAVAANVIGMYLTFAAGVGSTLTAPAENAWSAGNYVAAPGQVNLVASTSNVFRLTGVVLLPGTQAPNAAQSPSIMRPFMQELETCKRYYEKSYNYATLPGTAVGAGSNGIIWAPNQGSFGIITLPYAVEKRADPTVKYYAGNGGLGFSTYNGGPWINVTGGADPGISAKTRFVSLNIGSATSVVLAGFDYTADARL